MPLGIEYIPYYVLYNLPKVSSLSLYPSRDMLIRVQPKNIILQMSTYELPHIKLISNYLYYIRIISTI